MSPHMWASSSTATTSEIGKTAVAPGWDQWYTELDASQDTYYDWDLSRNGRRIHYGSAPRDYAPRVFERSAVRLVRRFAPHRRPIFLEVDEIAPHPRIHGKGTRCGAVPDPRDIGKFGDVSLPRPPSFNEADVSDKPSFLARPAAADGRGGASPGSSLPLRPRLPSGGRPNRWPPLSRVQRPGELDRTVFIFYTDNGVFFGEHGSGAESSIPYEEADRTPLYIRLPPGYRGARVPQVNQPVANIDLAPTMLALAHARPCSAPGHCRVMDGRNLLPLLRGRSPRWSAHRPLGVELHLAYSNRKHAACVYAGVRVPEALFVRHTRVGAPGGGRCIKDVERERYDLAQDPYELHNLCFGGGRCPDDPQQRRLQHLLERIRHCSGVRGRDPRPKGGRYCG